MKIEVVTSRKKSLVTQSRFSGFGGPANWIAADILLIENGVLPALGRNPGRSQRGASEKQGSNVWKQLSDLAVSRSVKGWCSIPDAAVAC
jgi:hypothetical protein